MLVTAILAAVVTGLVVYAVVQITLIQPSQPVVTVDGKEISTEVFKRRVRLQQFNLQLQFQNVQQISQILADDPQAQSSYQSQLIGITQQLSNPILLGTGIIDQLIQEALMEDEAERRGIEITEGEVDTAIEESRGFFGDPTPVPEQSTAETPPTPAGPPTPEGPPSPTATPYTREVFEQSLAAFFTNAGIYGVTEEAVRAEARASLLRDRLQETFVADVPSDEEQVWARHILVETEEEADDVLERIDMGEEWEVLAAELSLDTSNKDSGGDLGWFGRDRMVAEFQEAAFAGEIGSIAGPVETSFGWHLIEILGHEDRPMTLADIRRAAARALDEWIAAARETAEIEIFSYWSDRVPDLIIIPSR